MKNATRNWKTTLAGILTLAFMSLNIYKNPTVLFDPAGQAQVAATVIGAGGLIAAKDGDKSGTV